MCLRIALRNMWQTSFSKAYDIHTLTRTEAERKSAEAARKSAEAARRMRGGGAEEARRR